MNGSSLIILAFPCGQFGGQEFENASQIRDFAKSKGVPVDNPDLGFRMMEKVDVNGPNTHPVFKFLKGATEDPRDIRWNFASYWIVGKDGVVQRLAGGRNTPSKFSQDLAQAMN